jgi:hypothetical protein
MGKQELEYSPFENSICGKICAALGMKNAATAVTCWERHKNMIADVLNAKKADVTGAIKKEFLPKYKTQPVADFDCLLTTTIDCCVKTMSFHFGTEDKNFIT